MPSLAHGDIFGRVRVGAFRVAAPALRAYGASVERPFWLLHLLEWESAAAVLADCLTGTTPHLHPGRRLNLRSGRLGQDDGVTTAAPRAFGTDHGI